MAKTIILQRTPAELHKLVHSLTCAQQWLVGAHSLSGDEDGKFIEAAKASIEKALESLRKQHGVDC